MKREHWRALGSFDARPGGVGLLGVGPVALAGVAVALARRDRLVVTLAASAGVLVLLWLVLVYPPAPWDLGRTAGHARNLSLVALVLALSLRLSSLPSVRWRLGVGALLVALITWPTVVAPVRNLGLAIGHGVQLANARWVQTELIDHGEPVPMRRFQLRALTGPVADYLRDHTAADTRVLATEWPYWNVFLGTGRPNNAGFANVIHLNYHQGPEYWDARHYLEPAAIRRLGLEYLLATDVWVESLPDRARQWLADPSMFEPLISARATRRSIAFSRDSWNSTSRRIPSRSRRCGPSRRRHRSTSPRKPSGWTGSAWRRCCRTRGWSAPYTHFRCTCAQRSRGRSNHWAKLNPT